jgi:tetratricopeptide (TPR) repeat protein
MAIRDGFSPTVLRRLASRVGHRCSNPECRRETSGPQATTDGVVNIGVAAHITAASPGGKRFDPSLSSAQRSGFANGIWLCQSCAAMIDRDEAHFTRELLQEWKSGAETIARTRLQTPERPQTAAEPILNIPSMDPATSWLSFSARATRFVGRNIESALLTEFLESDRKFSWWLVTGPAGSGKSRLALELCLSARPRWNAGFLGRADTFSGWSYFRPLRPTLVVIDYVSSRVSDVGAIVLQLARSRDYLSAPVRILMLERDERSWWSRFLREESSSESAELVSCQYTDPLRLGPLSPAELDAIAVDAAASQKVVWTRSSAKAFEARMRTLDPLGRPLFGMMAAVYSEGEATDAIVDSSLLRQVLKRESARRKTAVPDDERRRKLENLVALATLVEGLAPRSGRFAFTAETGIGSLLPDLDLINRETYGDVVNAAGTDLTLSGLQPDILGERFILDRLAGDPGIVQNTKEIVAAAWVLQPDDLLDFVLRAASDFPADPGIDTLCDLSLDSPSARSRWGRLVGNLVLIAGRSDDKRSQRLLRNLRDLALSRATEAGLQRALAVAEFNLANIFLFSARNFAEAARHLEAAMAAAGGSPEIGAAIVNNRGILHSLVHQEDKALADWSEVIRSRDVPDESRASSLNNRADIFAQRGAHEDAIRDRSAVLALRDTSRDRRYIALLRRSNSLLKLGRQADALSDLATILGTGDISAHQKAEARVERGAILRDLGRFDEAREDLEMVLSAEDLFAGTFAEASVERAELARLEGDSVKARKYLDAVLGDPEAAGPVLVEALIVTARLLAGESDQEAAEAIWQSVLTNPNATPRQRTIAASRDK